MKRVSMLILAGALMLVGCSAKSDKLYFENIAWGMTMEEVKAQVKGTPDSEGKMILIYKNQSVLGSENVEITYTFGFDDGELYAEGYRFERTTDSIEAFGNYSRIKTDLIKKYGDPSESKIDWSGGTQIPQSDKEVKEWGLLNSNFSIIEEWEKNGIETLLGIDSRGGETTVVMAQVVSE